MNFTLPTLLNYSSTDSATAYRMLETLWSRFSNNQGATSLPYWMDKFTSEKQANRMIKALADNGIIETTIKHNWAEIKLSKDYLLMQYTQAELNKRIKKTRLNKYMPQLANDTGILSPTATNTKLTSGVKQTGLARFGFAEAGKIHSFKYDTIMMAKYKTEIVKYSVKAMTKMEEKLNKCLRLPEGYDYESLIKTVIDIIIESADEEYVLGKLTNDSRGRAIYECLRTIFNPLANKMARALVVAPAETVTTESLRNAYLYVAELYDGFNGNIYSKWRKGKKIVEARKFHKLDLSTEAGIDNLYENIWLERLYNDIEAYNLDSTHQVTTPLEVDFSSSNMVMIGLLLGHSDYVDHKSYMWNLPGLTKNHVKFAQTPYVFGSSAGVKSLWVKNKLTFTPSQITLMKQAQTTGKFSIANKLKDIIIKHCNPSTEMTLCVQQEEFIVECNKTKNVGDTTKQYVVYNSSSKQFSIITHTKTHTIPDLKQFKRYFMTGLIHNLDSQILDNIVLGMNWMLPIHDAGIVTWVGASRMRKLAVREMQFVLDNNKQTMVNYLKSINLNQAGWIKYAQLLDEVEQLNIGKEINLSPYLLK